MMREASANYHSVTHIFLLDRTRAFGILQQDSSFGVERQQSRHAVLALMHDHWKPRVKPRTHLIWLCYQLPTEALIQRFGGCAPRNSESFVARPVGVGLFGRACRREKHSGDYVWHAMRHCCQRGISRFLSSKSCSFHRKLAATRVYNNRPI